MEYRSQVKQRRTKNTHVDGRRPLSLQTGEYRSSAFFLKTEEEIQERIVKSLLRLLETITE